MAKSPGKVIFIDRDGVINVDKIGGYITTWEEFKFIPGTISALKALVKAQIGIVIISNQAGIGDGVYSKRALDEITDKMLNVFEKERIIISGVYYCLHGKQEGCGCRKPQPGLFEQAAKDMRFNPHETYFIGDKATDMEAGNKYGLRTIFVLTGHGATDKDKLGSGCQPEKIVPSIVEAAQYVIEQQKLL
jgi:D-glycero-D-manno-heptose 1,7-bisphosphate phosphatase